MRFSLISISNRHRKWSASSMFRNAMKMMSLFSIGLCFVFYVSTTVAQVVSQSQHGTNCMSADLAQGELFQWNRNGLTNNFSQPLFVICPLPLEHSAIPAGSTNLAVGVDWYLPPTYSETEGPLCIFRIAQSGFGSPDLNFINNVSNRAQFFPNGTSGFAGITDFFVPIDFDNGLGDTVDSLISSHILCLVPSGTDLVSYNTHGYRSGFLKPWELIGYLTGSILYPY